MGGTEDNDGWITVKGSGNDSNPLKERIMEAMKENVRLETKEKKKKRKRKKKKSSPLPDASMDDEKEMEGTMRSESTPALVTKVRSNTPQPGEEKEQTVNVEIVNTVEMEQSQSKDENVMTA